MNQSAAYKKIKGAAIILAGIAICVLSFFITAQKGIAAEVASEKSIAYDSESADSIDGDYEDGEGSTAYDSDGYGGNKVFYNRYQEFGLEYSSKDGRLYFNGKKVRCFADRDESVRDAAFAGSISQDQDGEIDVVTVKDEQGKITGLREYDVKDTIDYIKMIYE